MLQVSQTAIFRETKIEGEAIGGGNLPQLTVATDDHNLAALRTDDPIIQRNR
jgi:hypothetical protein